MANIIDTTSLPRRPSVVASSNRVPPHNLQAEESLLGAMLLSRDAIASAIETCSSDDFYKPAHTHVYDAITALYAQGEPADPVTVAEELRRAGLLEAIGGPSALISLQANTPAISNAARYGRIVQEHALLRRLISVAGDIAEMGYSVPDDVIDVVDRAESMVFDVAQRRVSDTLMPLRDLLSASLDRLEALYDRGESITGVPTGFHDLDERLSGLQPSNLVIVGARPAMGKCVVADTPMVDPETGELCTIEELHRRGVAEDGPSVFSLDDARQLRVTKPSAFVDDGTKPAYRVRTRLGREVATTLSHPFLTETGWRPLAEIAVGTRIAVPNQLPVFGTEQLPLAEVVLLAFFLASGTTDPMAPMKTTGSELVDEIDYHATVLGANVVCRPTASDRICRLLRRSGKTDGLRDLLERYRLAGVEAQAMFLPSAITKLPREQLATFLNRFFAVAGSAWWPEDGDTPGRLSVRVESQRLAGEMQHLLLRFGINARVRRRISSIATSTFDIEITEAGDLIRFADGIGCVGKSGAVDALAARAVSVSSGRLNGEKIWSQLLQTRGDMTWREVSERVRPAKAGGGVLVRDMEGSPDSAVLWDEIVSVELEGLKQVYDLTVPGDHNFVAADVFVHNTSFALGIAAHAAMEAKVPTLLFSLEMSHLELTQRLICAEARVDASRMRNGRLHESDWPKISHAIGRLGEAPIYIDDSPNVTVMDVRAKARRLKSKGGLGLVIIDYLQLMSGRSNAENRQVEVSEMSRGLKILARELEMPVIALSQLSRNLEMRSDKRPVLADLRESGSLEQDSDVVMFLYRDEIYNADSADRGTAEVIVSKHRNGPTGVTQLAFLDHYTRFANMARV